MKRTSSSMKQNSFSKKPVITVKATDAPDINDEEKTEVVAENKESKQ